MGTFTSASVGCLPLGLQVRVGQPLPLFKGNLEA